MVAKATQGRVLLVDDDPNCIDLISEVLKKTGLEIEAAKDGVEAFNKFTAKPFELIITDLMMPRMDGLALLKEIRKKERDAVVLVITGFGTIESAVSAIKAGAYDYITKPIKLDELEVTINRALEKRRLINQFNSLRGIFIATLVSIPIWLIIGVILGWILK